MPYVNTYKLRTGKRVCKDRYGRWWQKRGWLFGKWEPRSKVDSDELIGAVAAFADVDYSGTHFEPATSAGDTHGGVHLGSGGSFGGAGASSSYGGGRSSSHSSSSDYDSSHSHSGGWGDSGGSSYGGGSSGSDSGGSSGGGDGGGGGGGGGD